MHLLCLRPESSLRFYYDWGESNKSWKCPVKHQVLKRWAHHRCQQVWATFCCAFFNTLFNISWKDPYIPHHESIVQALKWHVVHTHTKSKLLFLKKKKKNLCSTLCHCASGILQGGLPARGGCGIGEGQSRGEEEKEKAVLEGGVILYSTDHCRPVVHERSPPPKKRKKNSSCSAPWQDPPDCSPHKEPQLPEHYWLKETEACTPPLPPLPVAYLTPSLLHTQTCPLCLFYILSFLHLFGAQIAPKNYAYHTSGQGRAPSVEWMRRLEFKAGRGCLPCVSLFVNWCFLFLLPSPMPICH